MNWKTTLSGVAFVGALCAFLVSLIPTMAQGLPWLVTAQPYLALVAAVAGFVNAYWQKDKDITGGTRRTGATMVVLLAPFLPSLLAAPPAMAGTVQLTFAWQQTISADFAGWKLHKATSAGGPYTECADIKYDGQQK